MLGQPMDTAQLAEQVSCCTQDQDADQQRLQLTLLRLLAEGAPVEPERLSGHTELPDSEVRALLAGWHGVHRDEVGRVVAFRGLSVVEAPHRLRVEGRELFTWCAWDTLLLPQLIGCPAEVESICPTTGATVSLRVGSDGPSEVSPADAVLSFIRPGPAFTEDTVASFCRFVHFFASPQAAEAWIRRHPGTFVISIEQGFEIGRRCSPKRGGEDGHPQH
jgi:alkylmercury lyase